MMVFLPLCLAFALISTQIEDDIIARAGGKAPQIIRTYNALEDSQEREFALQHIQILGTIDLLEFDSAMFVQNLHSSCGFLDSMAVSDTLFLKYLLDYRIYFEPPSNYKPLLNDIFRGLAEASKNPAETAVAIDEWADLSIISDSTRLLSPGRSVMKIFTERTASNIERSIFLAAAMRSLGIPSRLAFLPAGTLSKQPYSWLEFYSDGGWLPFYPDNPDMTGNFGYVDEKHGVSIVYSYSANGTEERTAAYANSPKTVFLTGSLVSENDAEFSVSAICSGTLKPLDFLDFKTDSSGGIFFSIGEGDYYFVTGARDEDGSAQVDIFGFTVGKEDTVFLSVENPVLTENFAYQYMTSAVFDYFKSLYSQSPCIILLGDKRSEPYRRMSAEIEREIPDVKLYFADSCGFAFIENDVVGIDGEAPIVIGLSSDNENSFFISGYYIDITRRLKLWLERIEED
ncbi:transglutaminase domain-containing protein [candidate division WOR-3 bacterium]|nr:transglutaminase domain-containing protein [candidate division WOR-3 bacterium]